MSAYTPGNRTSAKSRCDGPQSVRSPQPARTYPAGTIVGDEEEIIRRCRVTSVRPVNSPLSRWVWQVETIHPDPLPIQSDGPTRIFWLEAVQGDPADTPSEGDLYHLHFRRALNMDSSTPYRFVPPGQFMPFGDD